MTLAEEKYKSSFSKFGALGPHGTNKRFSFTQFQTLLNQKDASNFNQ